MPFRNINWQELGLKLPHCLAPWKVAFIQADGRVRPCCIYPPSMGNTNLKPMEEIWNDLPYQRLRQSMWGKIPLSEICATCNDGMRVSNVEEYILFAMEEMAQGGDDKKLAALFNELILRDLVIVEAIPMVAKLHRESGDSVREHYYRAFIIIGESIWEKLTYLKRLVFDIKAVNRRVVFDVMLWKRFRQFMPEIADQVRELLNREFASMDECLVEIENQIGPEKMSTYREKIISEIRIMLYPKELAWYLVKEYMQRLISR